jgi:hypothetical protein
MFSLFRTSGVPATLISTIVHVAALGAMAFYKITIEVHEEPVAMETVVAEEREQQEFDQELSLDTSVSQNLGVSSGGMVSTGIGAAASQPLAQAKIGQSEVIKDPEVRVVTIGDISIPGVGEMGLDLGEGQVKGETGARVEGYGAAMHRVSGELIRMMRKEPVLVVWLFDASGSLTDDRKEIAANVTKIYEELKISQEATKATKGKVNPLETMVCSLGSEKKNLLPKPTTELADIQKAMTSITEDLTGQEKTFGAISRAIDEFAPMATRADRKLVLIVVTDETGDDDDVVEEVMVKSDKFNVPIYFMGREAIFGSPRAHIVWTNPKDGVRHWIPVDRGPETPLPECLQFDGLHGRWDSHSSGFGPYGQVRLAKHTGGIFFVLAGEEASLAGSGARDKRRFDDLAMKEYEPQLMSRREYEQARNKSDFRSGIAQVINALNPSVDKELSLKDERFSLNILEFMKDREKYFGRCLRTLAKVNEGIKKIEQIEPLRAKEKEPRWRAAYDLIHAQLLCFRVREFQYLLTLEKHAREKPQPKDPKSTEWHIVHVQEMLAPTPDQVRATKVDMEELEKQKQNAVKLYDQVIKNHPGTPWERVARQEKAWGFGYQMRERYRDEREYDSKDVPKF